MPLFRNEEEIGMALRRSGIARRDIYLTTKVCIDLCKPLVS
jgi:diketogulonate reductase-like aldo/keto reductase